MLEDTIANDCNKELEAAKEEIDRLSTRLLRANNALVQYAYIASHDLQEPLRKIQIYAEMLKHSDMITEKNHQMLEKITTSANRMRLLIKDVIAHAEVMRSDKMFRPVRLDDVIAKVIDDFELTIKERGVSITVEQLPTVNAVALEINQLFYNLIDNALKFSDPWRTPQIIIRCKKLKTAAVLEYIATPKAGKTYYDISISDNGIGFNAKYAEQIFKVFNRLHPKEIYPGSGIGLSLCRNIVANHNGILFVESKPGDGSAFHIIIPN